MNVTTDQAVSCAACGHEEIVHGDRAIHACAPWEEVLQWDLDLQLWRSHFLPHSCDCEGWQQ